MTKDTTTTDQADRMLDASIRKVAAAFEEAVDVGALLLEGPLFTHAIYADDALAFEPIDARLTAVMPPFVITSGSYQRLTPQPITTGPLPRVMNVSNEANQDAVSFYINGDGWYLVLKVSATEKEESGRGWRCAFWDKWCSVMSGAQLLPTFEPGADKRLDELDGLTRRSGMREATPEERLRFAMWQACDRGASGAGGLADLIPKSDAVLANVDADPRTKPHEPPLPVVFIRRGERVLWDGALICEAKIDILNTDVLDMDDFRWFVTKPKHGEPAAATRGFRDVPVGGGRMVVEVFVEGEWRRAKKI